MVSCAAYLEITKISIHAPARGATSLFKVGKTSNALFQSTPPARGGDSAPPPRPCGPWYFNPRPPRGGRRYCILSCGRFMLPFQSTPPARGATQQVRDFLWVLRISIHAPREGGEAEAPPRRVEKRDFNPRPPRGGRRGNRGAVETKTDFNPRPPRGGATEAFKEGMVFVKDFYPRPPRGGAT